MQFIAAWATGLIFGLGLIVSGMTDPSKVIDFQELDRRWDTSLAIVLGGAIVVGVVAFRFSKGREQALLGDGMRWPTARQVDRRLLLASLAFGTGWALAGYCPACLGCCCARGRSAAYFCSCHACWNGHL